MSICVDMLLFFRSYQRHTRGRGAAPRREEIRERVSVFPQRTPKVMTKLLSFKSRTIFSTLFAVSNQLGLQASIFKGTFLGSIDGVHHIVFSISATYFPLCYSENVSSGTWKVHFLLHKKTHKNIQKSWIKPSIKDLLWFKKAFYAF